MAYNDGYTTTGGRKRQYWNGNSWVRIEDELYLELEELCILDSLSPHAGTYCFYPHDVSVAEYRAGKDFFPSPESCHLLVHAIEKYKKYKRERAHEQGLQHDQANRDSG